MKATPTFERLNASPGPAKDGFRTGGYAAPPVRVTSLPSNRYTPITSQQPGGYAAPPAQAAGPPPPFAMVDAKDRFALDTPLASAERAGGLPSVPVQPSGPPLPWRESHHSNFGSVPGARPNSKSWQRRRTRHQPGFYDKPHLVLPILPRARRCVTSLDDLASQVHRTLGAGLGGIRVGGVRVRCTAGVVAAVLTARLHRTTCTICWRRCAGRVGSRIQKTKTQPES